MGEVAQSSDLPRCCYELSGHAHGSTVRELLGGFPKNGRVHLRDPTENCLR